MDFNEKMLLVCMCYLEFLFFESGKSLQSDINTGNDKKLLFY